jgi:transcriptional regulator with XRE-family HTH domain
MQLSRMKDMRNEAGLTQVEVGKRMGTTQGRVTTIECGASVRPETAERVARAIGCSVEDLVEPREPVITLKMRDLTDEQIAVLTASR